MKWSVLFIVHILGMISFGFSDSVIAECTGHVSPHGSVDTDSSLCTLQSYVLPLNHSDDYSPLIEQAGQAEFVLLGDATHGTHEFYEERITISKRLIQEKGFTLIGIEGDWANVQLFNQTIHSPNTITPIQALRSFTEWPDWVWKNEELKDFLQWLIEHNNQIEDHARKVHIFGMDLYNFNRSQQLVREYVQQVSSEAKDLFDQRNQCFSRFQHNLHRYGAAIDKAPALSCQQVAEDQYQDFVDCRIPCPDERDIGNQAEFFQAQLNALTTKDAEQYFRLLYQGNGDVLSWNSRDRHMLESLSMMREHLGNPKTLVWAHSSHVGNAVATDRADLGELNLGQLLHEEYPNQVFSLGMLTYVGQLLASDQHYGPVQKKSLLPAQLGSHAALFHQLGLPRFLLLLQEIGPIKQWLNIPRPQRHIGVVYVSDNEQRVHYTVTRLVDQFDAVIFLDVTTPLGSVN